jgi:hypothetical protein
MRPLPSRCAAPRAQSHEGVRRRYVSGTCQGRGDRVMPCGGCSSGQEPRARAARAEAAANVQTAGPAGAAVHLCHSSASAWHARTGLRSDRDYTAAPAPGMRAAARHLHLYTCTCVLTSAGGCSAPAPASPSAAGAVPTAPARLQRTCTRRPRAQPLGPCRARRRRGRRGRRRGRGRVGRPGRRPRRRPRRSAAPCRRPRPPPPPGPAPPTYSTVCSTTSLCKERRP